MSEIISPIYEAIAPYKDKVIVCLETAADYMGLSCGLVEPWYFRVFSESPIEGSKLTVEVLPGCFASKEVVEYFGLICTSEEQTLLDMLEYDDVDIQPMLEALARYYFTHGESFDALVSQMSDKQRAVFKEWRQDAIEYYNR